MFKLWNDNRAKRPPSITPLGRAIKTMIAVGGLDFGDNRNSLYCDEQSVDVGDVSFWFATSSTAITIDGTVVARYIARDSSIEWSVHTEALSNHIKKAADALTARAMSDSIDRQRRCNADKKDTDEKKALLLKRFS